MTLAELKIDIHDMLVNLETRAALKSTAEKSKAAAQATTEQAQADAIAAIAAHNNAAARVKAVCDEIMVFLVLET